MQKKAENSKPKWGTIICRREYDEWIVNIVSKGATVGKMTFPIPKGNIRIEFLTTKKAEVQKENKEMERIKPKFVRWQIAGEKQINFYVQYLCLNLTYLIFL